MQDYQDAASVDAQSAASGQSAMVSSTSNALSTNSTDGLHHQVARSECELHENYLELLSDDVLLEVLEAAYCHPFPHCVDFHLSEHGSFAMAQVSRRLRRLALACPKLWACIHVRTPCGSTSYLTMLETYLQRSGDVPLNIVFRCDVDPQFGIDALGSQRYEEAHFPMLERCWYRLQEYSSRWGNLALLGWRSEDIQWFLDDLETFHTPNLKHLTLTLTSPDITGHVDPHPLAINPSGLDFLSLNRAEFIYTYPPLAYGSLTQLVLWGQSVVDLDQLAAILSHLSRSLRNLHFTYIRLHNSDGRPVCGSTLSSLRQLVIEHSFGHWPEFFNSFKMPRVEKLIIAEDSFFNILETIEKHDHGWPNVKVLACNNVMRSVVNKLSPAFIRAFPAVQELNLSLTVADSFWMLEKSSPIHSWPALRVLTVTTIRVEDLLEIIQQRVLRGSPFREVRLPQILLDELVLVASRGQVNLAATALVAIDPVYTITKPDGGSHCYDRVGSMYAPDF